MGFSYSAQDLTQKDFHLIRLKQISFHQNNRHRFKVNRKCSACKNKIGRLDVMFIGQNDLGLWYVHNGCGTTMLELGKKRFKGPEIA